MGTIYANCPEHGNVSITTDDINVMVWKSNSNGQYRFTCPEDKMTILKDAEHRTVDLLVASGVTLRIIQDAFMYSDREQDQDKAKECGPLDWDDLIDFHDGMERLGEDVMTELVPGHDSI